MKTQIKKPTVIIHTCNNIYKEPVELCVPQYYQRKSFWGKPLGKEWLSGFNEKWAEGVMNTYANRIINSEDSNIILGDNTIISRRDIVKFEIETEEIMVEGKEYVPLDY